MFSFTRLAMAHREPPRPGPGEVRLRVAACGVCRTDLHVVDGDLPGVRLPIVPGHQVVGHVEALGAGVTGVALGARLGVPWLWSTCGQCRFCRAGRENLCDEARFAGFHVDGGYADHIVCRADFAVPIPEGYPDLQAAPLLCAGVIGYRSYRMTGDAVRIGFYGFGQAAHVLVQVAAFEGREVYAFTRAGDTAGQAYARSLGAVWAGASTDRPDAPLDAAVLFAPVGDLVPAALAAVTKGGVVVCAGIHMSDIPSFPYSLLWGERVLRSVANLTRRDAREFLALAPRVPVRTDVQTYALEEAPRALDDLRAAIARAPAGPTPKTLCGRFTFADIAAAQVLGFVSPPAFGLRIGRASRESFTRPELLVRYADLLKWRDALYAAYRPRTDFPA